MRIDLFNGQSYIEIVDVLAMGNTGKHAGDLATVDGARVSFGRKASEFSFEKNQELAQYLWSAHDASPFTQCMFQMRVRMPIHIALWWFLFPHAEYNEISGRYTKSIANVENCFVPPDAHPDIATLLQQDYIQSQEMYSSLYDGKKFEAGERQVAKELARASLLYTFSTEFIFTISLRKLAHFLMQFANHPLFTEVNQAFLQIMQEYAPIFAEAFIPFWQSIASKKSHWPTAQEASFTPTESTVLEDNIGALKITKVTGSDGEIADTLRTTQQLRGDDYSVITHALRGCDRDDLPIELAEIGMHMAIRCPVYIFRQMYRHKRAAWYGLRTLPDRFYIPKIWRAQTKGSRYVFDEFTPEENTDITQRFTSYIHERALRSIDLIQKGVPAVHTERFLPYCFYVSVLRASDGIELFNYLNMRCDWHAQEENRRYAMRVAQSFAFHFPLLFLAWYENYWMGKDNPKNIEIENLYKQIKS